MFNIEEEVCKISRWIVGKTIKSFKIEIIHQQTFLICDFTDGTQFRFQYTGQIMILNGS
jgi:hypothetical protein